MKDMKGKRPLILAVASAAIAILTLVMIWRGAQDRTPRMSSRGTQIDTQRKREPTIARRVGAVRHHSPSPKGRAPTLGLLVPLSEIWKWQASFAAAMKWMNEWNIPYVVVGSPGVPEEVLEDLCAREGLSAEVFPFERALEELKVFLLTPPFTRDEAIVSRLKDCVGSGTWLVVPEGSKMVSEILGISSERTETLNSTVRGGHLSFSQARCLVPHPILVEFPCGEWISAETLHGDAASLTPGQKVGLPLMLFKDPSATGIRVIPVAGGGIVDLNWDSFAGGEIGLMEASIILRNAVRWLAQKDDWRPPVEEPLLTVQGKVITNDGSPVSKAEVRAQVFADWGARTCEQVAICAEDGSFTLRGYAPSIYAFEISAEGYLQEDPFVMARCELGRQDEPTVIRMRWADALYGGVYYHGDKNSPAPAFTVRLFPADRDGFAMPQETTTDGDGEFAFKKVEHGRTVLLIAEKDEWAGSKVVEVPLGPGEQPVRVELDVLPSTQVRGRVIDVEGEIPIAEAKVKVEPGFRSGDPSMRLFASRLTREVSTDRDGSFVVRLVPDRWHLSPIAEGYAIWWDEGSEESGSATVTVSETRPQDAIVLKMKKLDLVGVRFYGIVYLPSGEPAPGATVVVGRSPVASLWRSTTDSFGRYVSDPIWRSRNEGRKTFAFTVRKGTLAAFHVVELKDLNEEVRQDLWLGEGQTISGFVRNSKGNPVEGARVFEANQRSGKREGEEVLSAADGSFILRGSTGYFPGGLAVRAEKVVQRGQGGVKYVGQVWFSVPRTFVGSLRDIDIIVARIGDISGCVLFHDGTPLRNALVEFKMFYTTGEPWERRQHQPGTIVLLGDEGEFHIGTPQISRELEGLFRRETGMVEWKEPDRIPAEAGEWDILVQPETPGSREGAGRADTVVWVRGVEPGTSGLEVRLPPLGAITGRVIDAWSHEPFGMLPIGVMTDDGTLPQQRTVASGTLSLQGGVFRVEGLVPRTYEVSLNPRGYHRERFLVRVPEGGQEVSLGEIALTPSWTVFGRLVEEGTGRWANAKVTAASQTTTTAEGIFFFHLTPMKSVQVQITPEDKKWAEVTLAIEYQGQPETHLGTIVLKPRRPS